MTFIVQQRNHAGKWSTVNMSAHHAVLDAAIKRVTICDEDGLFSPSFRIQADGVTVYDYKKWDEARRAV